MNLKNKVFRLLLLLYYVCVCEYVEEKKARQPQTAYINNEVSYFLL